MLVDGRESRRHRDVLARAFIRSVTSFGNCLNPTATSRGFQPAS